MEILLFFVVILIFVATLLMLFINVILLTFGEKQATGKSEQIEVSTVNQFQNSVSEKPSLPRRY
jgi:zona occludens toxin (predicted ATPase)